MATVDQLHYTSCRRGYFGGDGFQVRTLSDGLDRAHSNEIVAHCGYLRPKQRGESEYPVAYRGYPLSDGRIVLTSTVYAGLDYSGREGNCFAHSLVFERDCAPHPLLSLSRWTGWVRQLNADDDTDNAPSPLPRLECDIFSSHSAFLHGEVRNFLASPDRQRHLRDALVAVLCRGILGRSIVFRDTPEHNHLWVGATLSCLPVHLALPLTWSTYAHNERELCDINATVSGSTLRFDETDHKFLYFAIDIEGGVCSSFTGYEGERHASASFFAEFAVRSIVSSPERLAEFTCFLSRNFIDLPLGPDLGLLCALWQGTDDAIRWATPEIERLSAIVRDHLSPEADDALVNTVGDLVRRLARSGGTKQADIAVHLLVAAAQAVDSGMAKQMTATELVRLLLDRLHSGDRELLIRHVEVITGLLSSNRGWRESLEEILSGDELIDDLCNLIASLEADQVRPILDLVQAFPRDAAVWEYLFPAIASRFLVLQPSQDKADEILTVLCEETDGCVEVSAHVFRELADRPQKQSQFVLSLNGRLRQIAPARSAHIRARLVDVGEEALALAEFLADLERQEDPVQALELFLERPKPDAVAEHRWRKFKVEGLSETLRRSDERFIKPLCLAAARTETWNELDAVIRAEIVRRIDRQLSGKRTSAADHVFATMIDQMAASLSIDRARLNAAYILLSRHMIEDPFSFDLDMAEQVLCSRTVAERNRFMELAFDRFVFDVDDDPIPHLDFCIRLGERKRILALFARSVRRRARTGPGNLITVLSTVIDDAGTGEWSAFVASELEPLVECCAEALSSSYRRDELPDLFARLEPHFSDGLTSEKFQLVQQSTERLAEPLVTRVSRAVQQFRIWPARRGVQPKPVAGKQHPQRQGQRPSRDE